MSNVVSFVQNHAAVLAAVGVAMLDFAFALSPNLQSNGILHWVYLQLKGSNPPSA